MVALDNGKTLLALIAIFLGFIAFAEFARWTDRTEAARRDEVLDQICDILQDLDQDADLHEKVWKAVDICDTTRPGPSPSGGGD